MDKIANRITKIARGVNTRVIMITIGTGRRATKEVLSTPIEKVKLPEKFFKRPGGVTAPVEQYGFKVGEKVGERFADATAMVLKTHGVTIPVEGLDSRQSYVKRALAVMSGAEAMRDVTAVFNASVAPAADAAAAS